MRNFYPVLISAAMAMFGGFSASAQDAEDSFQPTTQVFEGTLQIDLAAMGGEVTTMEEQTLILTTDSPTTCTITLCNFNFGDMALGDIVVDNVAMSIDEDQTAITFSGSKDDLSLAGGFIKANVACEGSMILETSYLVMDIDVETMGMKIPVNFAGYPKAPEASDAESFNGTITIPTEEEPVVIEDQTVTITPTGDDTCTFSLYNFTFGGMPLGDIIIENVKVTKEEDSTSYSGSKEGLTLAYGAIVADVTCNGVEDAEGTLKMEIMVSWENVIIPVYFEGTRVAAGIESAVSEDADAPAEYYRLNGMKVDAGCLTPGLYIVKQGNKSHKTIIR